jgi:hypothetical protein
MSGHRGQLKLTHASSGSTVSSGGAHSGGGGLGGGGGGGAIRRPSIGLFPSWRSSASASSRARSFSGMTPREARYRQSAASADALRLQLERQSEQLLSQAAPTWRGVARNVDGAPLLRLSVAPFSETATRAVASGAKSRPSAWVQWAARAHTSAPASASWIECGDTGTMVAAPWSLARAQPPPAASETRATPTDAVVPNASAAWARFAPPQRRAVLPRIGGSSDGSGTLGSVSSRAARAAREQRRSHTLARVSERQDDGYTLRFRPVALPTASSLVSTSTPVRFLMAGSMPGSPLLHEALLAEARGYDHPLLLTTSAPCAALASQPAAHARCRRALDPLLTSTAVMPSAGASDGDPRFGCGLAWAELWWVGESAQVGRLGCEEDGRTPRPLWYAFTRRRVLFLALSGAHALAPGTAQTVALRKAARAGRASGAAWVVAYGEQPGNASSAVLLREALGDVGADLYVSAPAAGGVGGVRAAMDSQVGAEAVAEEEERGEGGSPSDSHRSSSRRRGSTGRDTGSSGIAVLGLGGVEGYARVRVADKTTLAVERVRAADGRVIDSFSVTTRVAKKRL